MRHMVLTLMALALLAGCASRPQPVPDILPPPVLCTVPDGLTMQQLPPQPPRGEYTQRDVAEYITRLHQWGREGWTRIGEIRKYSDTCLDELEGR